MPLVFEILRPLRAAGALLRATPRPSVFGAIWIGVRSGTRLKWLWAGCIVLALALLSGPAPAYAEPQVNISAPDRLASGTPAVLRMDVREGDCPKGRASVSIAKERRAFPWLFVSYLPQGELVRSTLEVRSNTAGFSYVFWDEGSYRLRAEVDCGGGIIKGDRLLAVGAPPAKTGATVALLAGVLALGIFSGYAVARMRRAVP